MYLTTCPYCQSDTLADASRVRIYCQFCGRGFATWRQKKGSKMGKTITHEMITAAIKRFEAKGRKIKKMPFVTPAPRNFAFPMQQHLKTEQDQTVEV
jgi:hypothetical protein